jgi:hypothetical protein
MGVYPALKSVEKYLNILSLKSVEKYLKTSLQILLFIFSFLFSLRISPFASSCFFASSLFVSFYHHVWDYVDALEPMELFLENAVAELVAMRGQANLLVLLLGLGVLVLVLVVLLLVLVVLLLVLLVAMLVL